MTSIGLILRFTSYFCRSQLGRLGEEVQFLTDVGDDFHGGFLLAHLRESQVDVLATPRGGTSTALARLAEDGSAEYEFQLRWDPDSSLLGSRAHSALHFASIAAFLGPGSAVIDRLLDAAPEQSDPQTAGLQRAGTLVSFDPNIRPSIVGSHEDVLPRFEELARRVDVTDTIGAGDTFMVSLIHDLHASTSPVASLGAAELTALGDRASALAAITVSREGADLPWAADITN